MSAAEQTNGNATESGSSTDNAGAAGATGSAAGTQDAGATGDAGGAGGKGNEASEGKAGAAPAGKTAEGAPQDKAQESAVPEAYAEFTVPEGVQLDPTMVTEFQATAKDLKLSQAQAQKLVDLQSKAVKAQVEQIATIRTGWQAAAKADKELGGATYDANLAVALKGIEAHGTPELQEFLRATGVSQHPEMIRLFYRLGKLVAEDDGAGSGGRGTANAGGRKTLGNRLYGGS